MTLHEAIQHALLQTGKSLKASEIAEVLNANNWYTNKDGSKLKNSQIAARVKSYPQLFTTTKSIISLNSNTRITSRNAVQNQNRVSVDSIGSDSKLLMKVLVNEKNFKAILSNENKIPDSPGLYCIRVKNPKALDAVFLNVLTERNHTIMYIGSAPKSLQDEFLNQELRAQGHGSFFKSLGAVLGYSPKTGSLVGEDNQDNYKFPAEDEQEIINWIDENLIINWVSVANKLTSIEEKLIIEHLPLLNITGNPGVLNNVRILKNKCKEKARKQT